MPASRIRRTLEVTANAAIIILALVVLGNLLWARLGPKTERFAPAVGTEISLKGVTWKENGTTLLLVLQEGCRYCEESAAFYRRLYDQRSQRSIPRIIAVMPGDREKSLHYLSERGVLVDDVLSESLHDLKVSATPTLLLIDHFGRVTDVWVGKLDQAQENKVIQRVFETH